MQESLGTTKRLCTKGSHKSHRTHWHFKKISGHRVTGCLTQTENNKLSGIVLIIPFNKHRTEKSLTKICFSVTEKIRKCMKAERSCTVNKETLTSPSSWSSTERRAARRAKDTMQKESHVAQVESFCKNYYQQKRQKMLKHTQRKL